MTLQPVTLKTTWSELLGTDGTGIRSMREGPRRQRWADWLRLMRQVDKAQASFWQSSSERCWGCAHRRGSWCRSVTLPCTVNPILTIRHNTPGMACMGMSFKPKQLQLDLNHMAAITGEWP